jgi:hypothetical protein
MTEDNLLERGDKIVMHTATHSTTHVIIKVRKDYVQMGETPLQLDRQALKLATGITAFLRGRLPDPYASYTVIPKQ